MKKILIISAVILVVAMTTQAIRIINTTGMLTGIEPHFNGDCSKINGVTGAEDITIDHQSSYAYISSTDRRAAAANNPLQGGIYGLDLEDPAAEPVLLSGSFSASFHPHW